MFVHYFCRTQELWQTQRCVFICISKMRIIYCCICCLRNLNSHTAAIFTLRWIRSDSYRVDIPHRIKVQQLTHVLEWRMAPQQTNIIYITIDQTNLKRTHNQHCISMLLNLKIELYYSNRIAQVVCQTWYRTQISLHNCIDIEV